jgi:hypothetical protein
VITKFNPYTLQVPPIQGGPKKGVDFSNLDVLKFFNFSYSGMKCEARIAQLVYQRDTGWTAEIRFSTEAKDSTVSRSTLGHTLPIPRVKGPERETGHLPPSSAEVKNGGAILLFPIRLHGAVINLLRTGTTLLFFTFTGMKCYFPPPLAQFLWLRRFSHV